MTTIATIPNPLQEVIGKELAAESFKLVGSEYKVNIDPASNIIATESLAGIKLMAPAAPVAAASTVTTATFDAVAKTITIAVDGTIPKVINVGGLDDEGTQIVLNAGVLELKNSSGTVLSSTPISQIDAQQISKTAAAAGLAIAVTNGGSITIAPADIAVMYPPVAAGAVTTAKKLMSTDGTSLNIKQAVSSLGTPLNYWVIVP
jgi:hypothetical protein